MTWNGPSVLLPGVSPFARSCFAGTYTLTGADPTGTVTRAGMGGITYSDFNGTALSAGVELYGSNANATYDVGGTHQWKTLSMRVHWLTWVVALSLGSLHWLAAVRPAVAAPVPVVIVGTVATVEDPSGLLDGSVTAGGPFVGVYVFDSATADSNPDPTVGDYWHTAAGYGISVWMGNYTFATDPAAVDFLVEVVDRPQGDNYLLRSYNNLPAAVGVWVDHIAWQLDDPTGTALANDALPLTPPNLADWQSWFGLTIEGQDGGDGRFFIRGHVNLAF
jgi:hypothetical protein